VPAAVRGQSGPSLDAALPAGETTGRARDASRFTKTLAELGQLALTPAGHLIEALADPVRRQRTMVVVAVVYALVWTLYAVISKSSHDLHPDMAETVVLMREWALGYPKHPPVLIWLVASWFTLFPLADWSYYLLAGVSLGLALYLSFLVAGEWLEGYKRAWVPFLLAVIPFYNFLALRFDHNAALIPLWAFTIWAFMRSLDTRHYGWGVLTGLGAAAAVLTKYWSVFLLLALALAALCHKSRAAYFRSSAPWLAALVVVLACAPHAAWLVQEGFPPTKYVAGTRATYSLADWLWSMTEYVVGSWTYAGISVPIVFAAALPSLAAIRDTLWPADPRRRIAAILFWIPLWLPLLAAAFTGTRLLSLWCMPAFGLLPVVLLMSPLIVVPRLAAVYTAAAAMAIAAGALVAAPLVAWWQLAGAAPYAHYPRLLAAELAAEWRRTTSQPLKFVGGPFELADPLSFYLPERPLTYYLLDYQRLPREHHMWFLAPWADRASIERDGAAIGCPSSDGDCLRFMSSFLARRPHTQPREVVLRRRWLGFEGPPAPFTIAVALPSARP
jgi:4-amino-4-deoxy-L-arabinose transferase-like glycosyltransferase